jgi:serine/threonine protein phosphatase 1
MTDRIVAVGDIHGHLAALVALVRLLDLQPTDTLVTLGDCIDRGPDSQGVVDLLIDLGRRYRVISLMGNHEELMLRAREGRSNLQYWLRFGGDAALDSYGPGWNMDLIPSEHWKFIEKLPQYYETDQFFFLHANYAPNQYIHQQDSLTAIWRDLSDLPGRHFSGKTAVLGHTPRSDHSILDLGYLKCIDTGCGHGGYLTALEVETGRIWQVDECGQERSGAAQIGSEA